MNLRSVLSLLIAASFAACAPRLPLATGLDRLRRTMLAAPSQRTLAELDVSADGRLDDTDAQFFAELSATAQVELTRRGRPATIPEVFYHGATAEAAPLWQTLEVRDGRLELGELADERVFELAVESRWLALQVRVASTAGAAPGAEPFFGLLAGWIPGINHEAMEPAAVCAAVETIDLAPLLAAGLTPTVILDLDSTITDGNIMDAFLAALVAGGKLSDEVNPLLQDYLGKLADVDLATVGKSTATQNAALLLERWSNTRLSAAARPNAKDMFYLIVGMMRGMSLADGEAAARAVFSEPQGGFPVWDRRAYADRDGCSMRTLLQRLQARGIEIYVLSATLDLLAWESARAFGLPRERAIGSLLEVVDGRFTGEVRDSAYYTKGAIARQWLPAPPLLAFGDSPSSDLSMLLEATGAAFMINPRPAFLDLDAEQAAGKLVAVTFDGTEESLAVSP